MGAVTTERHPVPGCRVYALGAMRYVPVASRGFVSRFPPDGFSVAAVARAPTCRGTVTKCCKTCSCARCFAAAWTCPCTTCRRWRATSPRSAPASAGACPRTPPSLGEDQRWPPRCSAVLAVLEAGLDARCQDHRRRAVSRASIADLSSLPKMRRLRRWHQLPQDARAQRHLARLLLLPRHCQVNWWAW